MKTFKELICELKEGINSKEYKTTSEKSQFGGHRPKIVHKKKDI